MAELIDKNEVKEIFPDKGEGSWTYNVTAKAYIDSLPTTTESEIRAKAIDEFAELLKKAAIRGAFEYKPDKKAPWRKELVYCKVVGTRKIDEIAKQLKEE